MKCLTSSEYADLIGNVDAIASADDLALVAGSLVRRARELGLVLTVEQHSLQPLAMGNLITTVQVREARNPA